MILEAHHDAEAFDRLRAEWAALVNGSPYASIFVTWEWQATWWKHLGEGELHLLTLRTDDGRLAGIAPLCKVSSQKGQHTFRWVGCIDVSDYLDVVTLPGYERALYDAMLDYLRGQDAPHWDYVNLCNIPQESPTHYTLIELARQGGLHARNELEAICPFIRLPATWDAYLDSLDKKQRHEIRRKMRRIEREAKPQWHIIQDGSELDAAMNDFIELHKKSAPEKRAFMSDQMVAFFHEMSRLAFDAGWLQLAFIRVNGDLAASMLNFDYRGGIYVYNSGFDPEKYASLSPGIVLLGECIRHAIETGRSRFDFLRGDEEYKFRFGAVATSVHNLLISPHPLP